MTTSHPTGRVRAGTWRVDPARSTATISVRELLRTVSGTIPVRSAAVTVDADGRPLALVAELDLTGVDTATPKRDHDLQGPRWFDTASHPLMRFASRSVDADGPGWRVPGTLTVRGTDSLLELAVEVVEVQDDRARAVATGRLDRYDAGVRHVPDWFIARRVDLRIEARLVREGS